jgi:hypothetical protein
VGAVRSLATTPVADVRQPFHDPETPYEAKLDGLRRLAFADCGRCGLASRNGHPPPAFATVKRLRLPEKLRTLGRVL